MSKPGPPSFLRFEANHLKSREAPLRVQTRPVCPGSAIRWEKRTTTGTASALSTTAKSVRSLKTSSGPFLSVAEFINRRVDDGALGKNGAIQAAVNAGNFNQQATQAEFSKDQYPDVAKGHINNDPKTDAGGTGVGTPGFLTQADVLQSLAPVITCRSDTFTIRGYGEAKDAAGKVVARSWCEAVVQRVPEFVDATNGADTAISAITPVNKTFGRRFEIISFRRVPSSEIL
jgi:hypothetical protein